MLGPQDKSCSRRVSSAESGVEGKSLSASALGLGLEVLREVLQG